MIEGRPPRDLDGWLDHVQEFGIKLGLDNVRAALTVLGEPQRSYPSILVGGTNGKGSTVAFATALLNAAGLRVGSTISPHLTDYRERFRIDNLPVSRGRLEEHAAGVYDALLGDPVLEGLTFFELGASLALSLFAAESVDAAVVEVGMGGEFDATRGCEPAVGVVVSVDEDHLRFLGPTVRDVARTKARIAPSDGVLVVGDRREDRAEVLREEAKAVGARVVEAWRRFSWVDGVFSYRGDVLRLNDVSLGLTGTHQGQNAACALAAVEALHLAVGTPIPSSEQAAHALAKASFPGRLESVSVEGGPSFLLDGAHNPAGADALAAELARRPRPVRRVLLTATKREKRFFEFLDRLLPFVDEVVCTRGLTSDKFCSPEELVAAVRSHPHAPADVRFAGSGVEAVRALRDRLGAADEVLVAGSLYLVGDVRPELGLDVA